MLLGVKKYKPMKNGLRLYQWKMVCTFAWRCDKSDIIVIFQKFNKQVSGYLTTNRTFWVNWKLRKAIKNVMNITGFYGRFFKLVPKGKQMKKALLLLEEEKHEMLSWSLDVNDVNHLQRWKT